MKCGVSLRKEGGMWEWVFGLGCCRFARCCQKPHPLSRSFGTKDGPPVRRSTSNAEREVQIKNRTLKNQRVRHPEATANQKHFLGCATRPRGNSELKAFLRVCHPPTKSTRSKEPTPSSNQPDYLPLQVPSSTSISCLRIDSSGGGVNVYAFRRSGQSSLIPSLSTARIAVGEGNSEPRP
jgi:hypothetical protein